MAIGGQQVGPVEESEILSNLNNGSVDADTLVFGPGLTEWTPLKDVPPFAAHVRPPAAPAAAVAPAPAAPRFAAPAGGRQAHQIDYKIIGTEMQFVEIELDPGESTVAEAGSMMYMTRGIEMETIFGDGSAASQQSGLMGKLLGAGKRLMTGESLFMTVFTNQGQGKQRVAFAAPYAGKIIPMDLSSLGGELICQKDAFLCAARGVSIGIAFQKKIGVGLFGGEGFIMERLQGDGFCFVHAGGTIHEFTLAAGEDLRVDTGCLVALQPSVRYEIEFVGKVKTALFGGEGLFFATLMGPGRVWLQSLPLSRLADRMAKALPRVGGRTVDEGSVLGKALGGLGGIISGDR
jgi:uncharacterized protein (TIGR00266 family)